MWRKLILALVVVPLGVILVALAVVNRKPVELILDPFGGAEPNFSLQAPLFLLLLGAFAVGLIAGAELTTGVAGALTIVALAVSITVGFGSIGLFAALRTGSGEAVQSLFPVFFVFLFLSSMALPRDLIQHQWFATVATWNPISYLLEAIRSLLITGWDAEALALGFASAAGIAVVGIAASSASLRTRMVRT